MTNIAQLLGADAEKLLGFSNPKIARSSLHLPGPDFVDRVMAATDRKPTVLRNLQAIFGHGRLAGTGYVSILPVDQGIEHSGAASFALAGGRRLFALGQRMETPAAGDIVAQPLGTQTYFWEYLDSVSPLHYVEGYSYVAPTLGDSVGGSNPYTCFMVVGRNSTGTMFWLSAPDSGYSVDDLAPATPVLFTGEYDSGTSVLHWMENGEADLAGYRLHRGSTADFVPEPGNPQSLNRYSYALNNPVRFVDVSGLSARYWSSNG